jgi:hypothetical protein
MNLRSVRISTSTLKTKLLPQEKNVCFEAACYRQEFHYPLLWVRTGASEMGELSLMLYFQLRVLRPGNPHEW